MAEEKGLSTEGRPRVVGLPGAREVALKRLNEAYVANLLEMGEFESRVAAVEQARTLDELELQVSDLPSAPTLTETETIATNLGNKKVEGGVLRARRVDATVSLGTLKLDYRNTRLPEGVVELNLDVHLGTCKIWIPEDCEIENRLDENLAKVRVFSSPRPGSQARTTLRITGKASLSTVKVYQGTFFGKLAHLVIGPK